jgi:hypothetical protein
MKFGIHPHWGIFLTEARVGEWATFAVNQGFSALEIRIDFRMLETGLPRFFDPKVISILQNARRRGLELQVGIEPYESHLCSWRSRLREDSLSRVRQILAFLEDNLPPRFIFVYSGKSDGRRELGTEYLIESLRALRDAFPYAQIGVAVGAEGDCLKTPEEMRRIRSQIKDLDLVLDAGWAITTAGADAERLKNLVQSAGDGIYAVHWRNFAAADSRTGLPLSRGRLLDTDFFALLSFLPASPEIRHVLDYRDRARKSYLADKELLEELAFRLRRRSTDSH